MSFLEKPWPDLHLKTFATFPGVSGYNHEADRTTAVMTIPMGAHTQGHLDWSFKEWRQFQRGAATPGHQVYMGALSHLSLDGGSRQPVPYFSLWFLIFIFKKKSVKTQ